MLETIYKSLVNQFSDDEQLTEAFWEEIETQYSTASRHYHSLKHLEALLQELLSVKEQIQDWYTVLFTLFYHDLVYNPLQQNNEESSAELAATRLYEIGYPEKKLALCKQQIIATKLHNLSEYNDTNIFLDADLSILGQSSGVYSKYINQIREEYKAYPIMIYNKGRAEVLNHFLRMPRIYKTDHFHEQYEEQAKRNIAMELKLLRW